MIEVLRDDDPGEEPRRSVTAGHRPGRRGGEHRRLPAVGLSPVLRAHDFSFVELRRRDLHLEGALLTDLLEGLRRLLHLSGYGHDRFQDRQPGEEFGRGGPLRHTLRPLVRHGLLRQLRLRGLFLQLLEF